MCACLCQVSRESRIEASALHRGNATDRCPRVHICNCNDHESIRQAANAGRHFPYTRHRPGIAPHRRHPVRTKCGRRATGRACSRFETRAASGQSGRETCASVVLCRKTDITCCAEAEVCSDTSLIVSANGVNVRPAAQHTIQQR